MPFILSCESGNDLYRMMLDNGIKAIRYDTPSQAVENAPEDAGVLLLADGYPERKTAVDGAVFETARHKNLRVYAEYPAMLPGIAIGEMRTHKKGPYGSNQDREIITSDLFGAVLPRMSIVLIHNCHYLAVQAENPHIVTARVAGYNRAVFGLPEDDVWPILFEPLPGQVMAATTKLSHFITGRYAPSDAWGPIWETILAWLQAGVELPELNWTATVRPSYRRADPLPEDAERRSLRRGIQWYLNSKLFLDPEGKKGFHEGYNSKELYSDGRHGISTQVRGDCTGEVSFSLALGHKLFGIEDYRNIATNLNNLLYFDSPANQGPRMDPQSPSYGLIGGDLEVGGTQGIYYGDDGARHLLGTMGCVAVLGTNTWNERAAMEMLANLRTTGPWGFRVARIEEPDLQRNGWQSYWKTSEGVWGETRYMPHYQAYLWAVNLWLYDKTHFEPLLRRTETGIRLMMEAYPDGWGAEANRVEPERCRMLLPLAWLIRVDDTPEHRLWLQWIKQYLLRVQHASGAIPQRVLHETTANEQYGTGECALIQANGDPCTDLLYAVNFAFIGLHEAAAATGDPELKQAADRLADFLVRIQIQSETHPELDGAWYRGFDFEKWDYWGSDGDIGWGVWCIETGWTQSWITITLALRELNTCYWDLTANSKIAEPFRKYQPTMLPDDLHNVPIPNKK